MTEKQRYIKNRINKRIFLWTAAFAANGNYAECDVNGKFLSGHIENPDAVEDKMTIEKAKYIGIVTTGRMVIWTEQLAKRTDVVAINSIEHWAEYLSNLSESINNDGAPIPHGTTAEAIAEYAEAARVAAKIEDATTGNKKDSEKPKDDGDDIVLLELPSIKNMVAAEAKQVMQGWVKAKFPDAGIDPELSVKKMMEVCTFLVDDYNNIQHQKAVA